MVTGNVFTSGLVVLWVTWIYICYMRILVNWLIPIAISNHLQHTVHEFIIRNTMLSIHVPNVAIWRVAGQWHLICNFLQFSFHFNMSPSTEGARQQQSSIYLRFMPICEILASASRIYWYWWKIEALIFRSQNAYTQPDLLYLLALNMPS